MSQNNAISKERLIELLNKNWMTHDAMWFLHCVQEFGIERTNRINRLAVRAMAGIEVKRIMKIISLPRIETFVDLQKLFIDGFEMFRPSFMKVTYSFPEKNLLRWEASQCFAHDGIKKMGLLDEYECGIMERLYGWLDGAAVSFSAVPKGDGCLMRNSGKCIREIRTELA